MNNNVRVPYVTAFLVGLVISFAITKITGRKEAWDSGAYFSVGIPLMVLVIFVLSYKFPDRAWRWTLAMALGQSLAMVFAGGSLNLWPLSIIAMTIYSIPQFLVGSLAAKLKSKRNN